MRRLPVLAAVVLAAALPASARAQSSSSFAQLEGTAGCILQTGVELDELDVEEAPSDCKRAGGLAGARSAVLSPDQRQVYVAAPGAGGISVFARDAGSGELSFLSCVTATGGDGRIGTDGLCAHADGLVGARALAFSPDGRFAYVAADGSA